MPPAAATTAAAEARAKAGSSAAVGAEDAPAEAAAESQAGLPAMLRRAVPLLGSVLGGRGRPLRLLLPGARGRLLGAMHRRAESPDPGEAGRSLQGSGGGQEVGSALRSSPQIGSVTYQGCPGKGRLQDPNRQLKRCLQLFRATEMCPKDLPLQWVFRFPFLQSSVRNCSSGGRIIFGGHDPERAALHLASSRCVVSQFPKF